MDVFYVDFHHRGDFVGLNGTYVEVEPWECDGDRWNYFEILDLVKSMGYQEVVGIWYEFGGKIKLLENEFGAIELYNWAKTKGKGHLYLVHPISQPVEVEIPLLPGRLAPKLSVMKLPIMSQMTNLPLMSQMTKLPSRRQMTKLSKQNQMSNLPKLNQMTNLPSMTKLPKQNRITKLIVTLVQ